MLLMSGAVVGSLGILGSALAVLVFALVAIRGRRQFVAAQPHDPEPVIADLTLRLRHPWQYRLRMIQRRLR